MTTAKDRYSMLWARFVLDPSVTNYMLSTCFSKSGLSYSSGLARLELLANLFVKNITVSPCAMKETRLSARKVATRYIDLLVMTAKVITSKPKHKIDKY
jgi:hypothetical protein